MMTDAEISDYNENTYIDQIAAHAKIFWNRNNFLTKNLENKIKKYIVFRTDDFLKKQVVFPNSRFLDIPRIVYQLPVYMYM